MDVPGPLRFFEGELGAPVAAPEIRMPGYRGQTFGWRDRPSAILVRGAGCYAFQVDGRTFSRVIVFAAAE
jgi:hypothetical protein